MRKTLRREREIARTFLKPDATVDEVGKAGLKLFVMLYGGKKSDTLSSLRYVTSMKMASFSSTLKPEKLPPSERAAWFHALRAYYQVQEWNSLMGMSLNGDKLMPIMTDEVPAPGEFLTVIRCNCQLPSKNTCGGKLYSCRTNGLLCVAACGDCQDMHCKNREQVDEDEEHDPFTAGNIDEFDSNIFENIFGQRRHK